MTTNRHVCVLAIILATAGLSLFAYKALLLRLPLTPAARVDAWSIEVRTVFTADGGPVKVQVKLPQGGEDYEIVDQSFVSPGYGMTTSPEGGNLVATFSKRSADGPQVIYYRAVVQFLPAAAKGLPRVRPEVRPPEFDQAERAAADSVVREVREKAVDHTTTATLLLARTRAPTKEDPIGRLLGFKPSLGKKLALVVDLLALEGIPARIVNGVDLRSDRRIAAIERWLEVHDGRRWIAIDPGSGAQGSLQGRLPWWQGRARLSQGEGVTDLDESIAVAHSVEAAIANVQRRGEAFDLGLIRFSLLGLPVATQQVYRLLLTVPLGILRLVLLRNVVGVRTTGTFMPVLIALSFRQTGALNGVLLFALVIGLGLLIRSYMEHLKLLLVPRLAFIVTSVLLLMMMVSVVSFRLGLEQGLFVALFPFVITAMTIEHISVVAEERGLKEALVQAGGSLLVAFVCHFAMRQSHVEHLMFVFPELLLVLLAAIAVLGRYSGYRLLELRRFKPLVGPS